MTCIHEAGHASVARHLGCSAYWRIFALPEGTFNPETEHRWLGRTWSDAGALGMRAERKIGLAGVIAEHLFDEPDASALSIYDYIGDEILMPSLSDWDMMAGYSYRDLWETVRLVRKLMPRIRAEVDCFLNDFGVSYG
ncbi:hypothetical protein MNR01_14040 [Lysobacter sp. S4-A87]|uniref:hypothetical protein n=1 Tax=Lysobacter sp. S4-A87 TaxID=2925843 RepID=UPI001F52F5EA|nr:hypothetical protein [Lysobacter sp. S4-A87]UNK48850.1 hypothetical protein MNR01_14040 [Lysobacter sp. S4-A87]